MIVLHSQVFVDSDFLKKKKKEEKKEDQFLAST